MVALQYHLQFLVDLQRHLGGSTRFPRWTGKLGLLNILRRATEWEQRVRDLPWEDDEMISDILNHSDPTKGPAYYRTLIRPPTLLELEASRKRISKALHGRCRTEFRKRLSEAIRHREELRTKGRAKQFLRSVLGEADPEVSL